MTAFKLPGIKLLAALVGLGLIYLIVSECNYFPRTSLSQQEKEWQAKQELIERKFANNGSQSNNTSPLGEFNENIWLTSNLSLSICRSTDKPNFAFLKGYKEVYREAIMPNEKISIVFPKSTNFLLADEHTDQPKNLVPSPEEGAKLQALSSAKTPLVNLVSAQFPQVIVERQSKEHFSYSAYSVQDSFPKLGTLQSNTELKLQKFDNEPFYRLVGHDELPGFGIQAVAPQVIFQLDDGQFHFDNRIMSKLLPNAEQRKALQSSIARQFKTSSDIPVELADTALNYYYCGQSNQAHAFLNDCWPTTRTGKDNYWKFLVEETEKSPYFREIGQLNNKITSIPKQSH